MKRSYRQKTLDTITSYLNGSTDEKAASQWALNIIKSDVWESLPQDVRESVHLLFDLHDTGEFWQPTRNELIEYKAKLQKMLSLEYGGN